MNTRTGKAYNEVHSFFLNYLDTYFTKRDFHETVKLFSKDIIAIGSAAHEIINAHDTFTAGILVDFEEIPVPIEYTIKTLDIRTPTANVGLISCNMDIKTTMENHDITFRDFRYSMCVTKHKRTWQIEHIHVSFPTAEDEGDASYPIKILEEKKEALEKAIQVKTKELEKQLSEKEVLLREVHHRVKNNIATIKAYLSLQAKANKKPEVTLALQDSIAHIQSMQVLYEKLLLTDNYSDVSVKNYVETLIDLLIQFFLLKEDIQVTKLIEDFCIPSKTAVSLGIIVNELLTNVFKHAFTDRPQGMVTISIKKQGNSITLIIEDDGIGSSQKISIEKNTGFGLTVVKMMVDQLNGTYSITSEQGTKIIIEFSV